MDPVQIVAMPYNVLLSEQARATYGIDLRGAVVVFDEGHNLVDAIGNVHTHTLSLHQVTSFLSCCCTFRPYKGGHYGSYQMLTGSWKSTSKSIPCE